MTALQKTLIIATMFAAVGLVYHEADEAATLRTRVQTLQRQQAFPSAENRQLRSEYIGAAKSVGTGTSIGAITGIMSDSNFRVVMHALENRSRFEDFAEPEAVTPSGRGIQGRYVWFDIPATSAAANPSPLIRQSALQ